jgi:hypothetical protein
MQDPYPLTVHDRDHNENVIATIPAWSEDTVAAFVCEMFGVNEFVLPRMSWPITF